MTLSKQARDAIDHAVQRLRTLFEDEFARQAAGTYGLHTRRQAQGLAVEQEPDPEAAVRPWVEPVTALSLTPTQVDQRTELVEAVRYLHGEGIDGGDAVARLIRTAAFTATNQLIAVRVAESIGAIGEMVGSGRRSADYRTIVRDLFPLLAQEDDEGLWTCIQICGDELGATVPLLFDRRLPTSAFVPGRACVDEAISIVNGADVVSAWADPEALGWAYQFFNQETERQRMRKESAAPRTTEELAIRNQFFTPRYVVDWLVQNTLGRRLREAGYELELPLLMGELGDPTPLDLANVRILDPAVGSGHFLLGCYDLLEKAWQTQGVSPAEAAPCILRSLHGIDIDPRASQVAQAVLMLRANQAAPRAVLRAPVIATANALPVAPEISGEVFQRLSQNGGDLATELSGALDQASTLGSLLKVEQQLDAAFAQAVHTPMLDQQEVTADRLERELVDAIEEIAGQVDASPAARLFAADAGDAMRFVQLCRQRYDVVLMNPPFGDPIPETRAYVQATYGSSAVDVYAAFVDRGIELLNVHGYLGAITSRTGFFLTTFENWRRQLILPRLIGMLDLGVGVMHDAMTEAAAYVLSSQPHGRQATFRRLVDERNKAAAVARGAEELFHRTPNDFDSIPGAPAAYWFSSDLRAIFAESETIDTSRTIDVRQGLGTADDFRFVRLWWEIYPNKDPEGRRWIPFAKGGGYSPYYADLHLLIDWRNEGQEIKNWGPSVVRNQQFYGRPGLTWSRRSQKGVSVRPVPGDAIFGDKGPMIFVSSDHSEDLDRLAAYLNSGLAAAMLEGIIAFGSYEVGAVERLPHVDPGGEAGVIARDLNQIRMYEYEHVETSHLFVLPWAAVDNNRDRVIKLSQEIDEAVSRAVAGRGVVRPLSATYPTKWFEEEYRPGGSPTAQQELSYLIGVAFGRWDVRFALGTRTPSPLPGPYDPLPPVSRGMLLGADGLPAVEAPTGYPIELPNDRLLHDEAGHSQDVVGVVEAVIELLESVPQSSPLALLHEIPDIRGWLRGRFHSDHLKEYSASRRYAPIYWYLSVPSREWGLWLYASTLSRERLFAVVRAARDKLRRVHEQARRLRSQLGGSVDRDAMEHVERLETLAAEVDAFAAAAEEVAQSGWCPDLNDGLVLCAAPLAPLLADGPWRSRVIQYRQDLERQKYPWATVQREFFGDGK